MIDEIATLQAGDGSTQAQDVATRKQELRRRLERLIGIAATEGNEILPLRNGDQIFPAMLRAVEEAEHTVDMTTFVYWRGDIAHRFAHALAAKARQGVRVRLLLDGFGSRLIERELLDEMDRSGVDVAWFRRPVRLSPLKQNHRCHRKVLVVDATTAFTGGVGIAEEWCGDARNPQEWRDTHVQVRGPAVDGIAAAFAQNWAECREDGLYDAADRFEEHRQPGTSVVQVVRGSASVGWQDMQTLLRVVISSAQRRLRLATAYFAPDRYFVDLLIAAAERGVDVEILLPGPHTDKRVCQLAGERFFEDLTAAGVRIWQYQPTMMHAKVLTVDGIAALVGSTNFNRRSLDHDEEIMLTVIDERFTARLDADLDQDLTVSERLDPGRWRRRSPGGAPWRRPPRRSGTSSERVLHPGWRSGGRVLTSSRPPPGVRWFGPVRSSPAVHRDRRPWRRAGRRRARGCRRHAVPSCHGRQNRSDPRLRERAASRRLLEGGARLRRRAAARSLHDPWGVARAVRPAGGRLRGRRGVALRSRRHRAPPLHPPGSRAQEGEEPAAHRRPGAGARRSR